jgi:hypothetical protein
VENEPETTEQRATSAPDEAPPPFDPDPELVTFLEKSAKQDPKKVWKTAHSQPQSR